MIKIEIEHRDRIRACRWALFLDSEWIDGYWHGFYEYGKGGIRDARVILEEKGSGTVKTYKLSAIFLQFTEDMDIGS